MSEKCLMCSISRNDIFPKTFELNNTSNDCYLSIVTSNWTSQMFYELPAINVNIYYNGECVKQKFIKTYNPMFPIKDTSEVIVTFNNLPIGSSISINPIFDENAIQSLKYLGVKDIEIGEPTMLFNTRITFINTEG